MPTVTWTLTIENTRHIVRLDHLNLIISRNIWLDGNCIVYKKDIHNSGSRDFLKIGADEYELVIATSGFEYSYFLLYKNYPIPSDDQLKKGITPEDLLKSRFLRDIPFVQQVNQALNLQYFNDKLSLFSYRHRMAGMLNGYLILISSAFMRNSKNEVWVLIVRHSLASAADRVSKIQMDSRVYELLPHFRTSKQVVGGGNTATWIYLPRINGETSLELAGRVRAFQQIVAESAPPVKDGGCEFETCRHPEVEDRKLVLINDFPWLICQDCIDSIPKQAEEFVKSREAPPDRILPGILAGIGLTILAVIISAMLTSFPEFLYVIGVLLFTAIIGAMIKLKTKLSVKSLVISAILAFIGEPLCVIAANIAAATHAGFPLNYPTLLFVLQTVFKPGPWPGVLAWAYVILAAYFGMLLWRLLGSRNRALHPRVVIIPGNY